jgi:hypothetical protein
MNTNWSSPKTNIFAGINDLRICLAGGSKARLIRLENEKCSFPIRVRNEDRDFRNYKFSSGYATSVNKIKADNSLSEFEKHLSLNYVSVFGSKEAAERYYQTGELSEDNFKNMGFNHLVQVDDLIKFYRQFTESGGHYECANMYERQYRAPEHGNDTSHFFDFFRYAHGSQYSVKKFKHKLWVVEMLGEVEQPKLPVVQRVLMSIITGLVYPLKYVPRKSVLQMKEYRVVTYRVGDVTNGLSIDIHIPKKFGFK